MSAVCAHCGAAAERLCTGCGKVAFCLDACQKAHWLAHKGDCKRDTSVVEFFDDRAAWLALLPAASSVIHFKGFGPHVTSPPPPSLLTALGSAGAIVFDGDDWDLHSFTYALPVALACSSCAPPPLLLALKNSAARASFEASWKLAPLPAGARVCCLLVPDAELLGAAGSYRTAALAALPAFARHHAGLSSDGEFYVALGLLGVALTLPWAPRVHCWGGHTVPAREFAAGVAKWGEGAPTWVYHAATREKGGELQEGLLPHAAPHCKLLLHGADCAGVAGGDAPAFVY